MQNQPALAPKLSVTVLNYNYGHYLPTCLDSILKQTFTDFELILINDKSPDNSLEVLQPYLADPRVRLVDHTENQGFVRSLIEGSDLSRGEYITVISADDWILDATAFEKQIAIMDQDADIAFVFNNYGCYENEQQCNYLMCPAPASYIRAGLSVFQEIIIDRSPLHSGTIIRKTAYKAIGGYDPNTHYAADTKMWAGLCHVGKVAYINDVLYAYRVHNSNMSRSKTVVRQSINEVLQLVEWSFGMLSPAERRNLDWLYKKAIRRALASYSILFTFQLNKIWLGWYYFWIAVKIRPIETLLQKMLFILILRTVLGKHGYRVFEQITARFNKKTRARLKSEILHTGVSR